MIIFNINGDFQGVFSSLPNEDYLDESKWIIAEFADGETFDEDYNYSSVDGIALKGDLIPVDLAEVTRMKAEFTATQYQRDRQYPSVGDQLDMMMKDMRDGTTTHQTACEAVKAKYPKPE
jgi:hypothetical protein